MFDILICRIQFFIIRVLILYLENFLKMLFEGFDSINNKHCPIDSYTDLSCVICYSKKLYYFKENNNFAS